MRVAIIDPANPLYGRSFPAFGTTAREGGSGSVTIVLPDGQHRLIPCQATSLSKRGKKVIPVPDLPRISVRTILPLVRILRDKRILLGEGNNGTRNENAAKGRIPAASPGTESTSAPLAGAGNRSQAPTGLQLGAAHRTRKGKAGPGGST